MTEPRLLDAKTVYVRAIVRRRFGHADLVPLPIAPQSRLLESMPKSFAASEELLLAQKPSLVLTEVVFHCNQRDAALVKELPLSY
jgi:hypothetical protein